MKLSPGDQIQILLTVGGVPYAKTKDIGDLYDWEIPSEAQGMMIDLMDDIIDYGDEHEESRQEG